MERISVENRSFIVKRRCLESCIDNLEQIKNKYNCKTVLKQQTKEGSILVFADEILDVDFEIL